MLRLNVYLPFAAQKERWRNREEILGSAQKELLFLSCLLKFVTLSWFFMKVLNLR